MTLPDALYIVTGATRGIGRAVAISLAARGYRVVAVGRSVDLLESLVVVCGPRLTVVAADLATGAGVERVVECVKSETNIAGIIHSAGSLVPLQPFDEIDSSDLVEHFRIHVGAPIALHQSLYRSHSIERVLFIDSYSASSARHGWGSYSIVKAAAQMAARCAAQELANTRTIRAYPGAVNTQIVDTVLASNAPVASTFRGMLKKGEFAEPDDVARFLVALLIDASEELLDSRDVFDYNNSADRDEVLGL